MPHTLIEGTDQRNGSWDETVENPDPPIYRHKVGKYGWFQTSYGYFISEFPRPLTNLRSEIPWDQEVRVADVEYRYIEGVSHINGLWNCAILDDPEIDGHLPARFAAPGVSFLDARWAEVFMHHVLALSPPGDEYKLHLFNHHNEILFERYTLAIKRMVEESDGEPIPFDGFLDGYLGFRDPIRLSAEKGLASISEDRPPRFTLVNVMLTPGHSVIFSFKRTSYPPFSLTAYKDGEEEDGDENVEYVLDLKYSREKWPTSQFDSTL